MKLSLAADVLTDFCRITIAFIGWIVGFASSIDSAALPQAAKDFGVSEVTESLATGLFLIGFGAGKSILVISTGRADTTTQVLCLPVPFPKLSVEIQFT